MWVLGNQPGSSARTTDALKPPSHSPAPVGIVFKSKVIILITDHLPRADHGAWFCDGCKDKAGRICSTGPLELRQVTLRPITEKSERPGEVETKCYR